MPIKVQACLKIYLKAAVDRPKDPNWRQRLTKTPNVIRESILKNRCTFRLHDWLKELRLAWSKNKTGSRPLNLQIDRNSAKLAEPANHQPEKLTLLLLVLSSASRQKQGENLQQRKLSATFSQLRSLTSLIWTSKSTSWKSLFSQSSKLTSQWPARHLLSHTVSRSRAMNS